MLTTDSTTTTQDVRFGLNLPSIIAEINFDEPCPENKTGPQMLNGTEGVYCGLCGKFEEDTGDNDRDGNPKRCLSENLTACASCTDCKVHPECGPVCNHCIDIDNAKVREEMSSPDNIIGCNVAAVMSDLKGILEGVRSDGVSRAVKEQTMRDMYEVITLCTQIRGAAGLSLAHGKLAGVA